MKLPVLSGREMVKILSKEFGFKKLDQKGSHIIMIGERHSHKCKPVVPNHKELAIGTLLSILKQAEIEREDFEGTL